ncbi:MAG: chloride channel protein [Bacteroidales bacterium]|nr:chloride channel protein [Bacteroidales bacterium]
MKFLPKTSEYTRLLVLSIAVGLLSGLAAVLLERFIRLIQQMIARTLTPDSAFNWPMLLLPAVGMLLSLLIVRYLIRDNIGHGVTKVLWSISRNESRIKPHNTWSSLVTSGLTIGFGGSVGAEAPIVYTGAAIGSNLGRAAGMTHHSITVLVGCGAAGAIAGIFKAPLAGVLFTLEILMFNISMTSITPLLLSTVTSTVVSYLLLGDYHPFSSTLTPFSMGNMPFYLVLGVFCGLMSLYFTRTTLGLEDRLGRYTRPFVKWIVCAVLMGLLVALFPPLFGEGYDSVSSLLNGNEVVFRNNTPLGFLLQSPWGIPAFFLGVMLLKVLTMTLTNAGGGVGGTFGPTLFIGAIAGFVLSRTFNLSLPLDTPLPEQNFVLVGMAGLMAGVMQAPLTAIFLIAEITGGYELLLPLILCSTVSYGFTRIWEKYSIYTKRLAQSGDLLTHDNDQAVLTLLNTEELIRDKYPRVQTGTTLREIVRIITNDNSAVIAVLDGEGKFQGVLDVDKLRRYITRTDAYDKLHAYNLMENPPAIIHRNEKMESVMAKFDKTEAWRLPVIADDGSYLGFLSKSRILIAYRDQLRELSAD